jgi:hypothetical protein
MSPHAYARKASWMRTLDECKLFANPCLWALNSVNFIKRHRIERRLQVTIVFLRMRADGASKSSPPRHPSSLRQTSGNLQLTRPLVTTGHADVRPLSLFASFPVSPQPHTTIRSPNGCTQPQSRPNRNWRRQSHSPPRSSPALLLTTFLAEIHRAVYWHLGTCSPPPSR